MRTVVPLVALAAVAAPVVAYAASFPLPGGSLGAGAAAVSGCDGSFTIAYTTSGGNVTAVTVGDVADPACEGGSLSVVVVDAGGGAVASGGPVAVPADGDAAPNTVVVPVSGAPAAEIVAGVRIALAGP